MGVNPFGELADALDDGARVGNGHEVADREAGFDA